jgi:hypothetical protein
MLRAQKFIHQMELSRRNPDTHRTQLHRYPFLQTIMDTIIWTFTVIIIFISFTTSGLSEWRSGRIGAVTSEVTGSNPGWTHSSCDKGQLSLTALFSPGAPVSSYITNRPILSRANNVQVDTWLSIEFFFIHYQQRYFAFLIVSSAKFENFCNKFEEKFPLKSHRFSDPRNSVSMKTLCSLLIMEIMTIRFWVMICCVIY